MVKRVKEEKKIIDIGGKLKEIITLKDESGKVLDRIIKPIKVEFDLKDVLQVIIGATLLAIPVGFTEETWKLGESLPLKNVMFFIILSLIFISLFSYYHSYRHKLKRNYGSFVSRVILTYLFSFLVVGVLLTVIQKAPWNVDFILAFKRVVIVTLPASMSAAIADIIK